jgi:Fic family protein
MKIPLKAPTLASVFPTENASMWTTLFSKIHSLPLDKQAYLHWDELRFRPKPEGFSLEEWWAALKLLRRSLLRPIPLIGIDKAPIHFAVPNEVLSALCEIDRKLGTEAAFYSEVPTLSAEHKRNYLLQSLFEESITSSQIEGAVTTRAEAKAMLATKRPPRDKHEQMVLNNYNTLTFLKEHVQTPLSPELLLEVHRRITEKVPLDSSDGQGRWRRENEPIHLQTFEGETVFTPPPANELPKRMEALCAFFNAPATTGPDFIHPLLRAILVHFWLAYDHPFVDGNGRTARALFYFSALRQGYPLFEYISISEMILKHSGHYYRSFLYAETDENDATYFIINQLEMIKKSIEALYAHIREKLNLFGTISVQLHQLSWINSRQEQVLLHALKTPGATYTFETQMGFHKISFQTAREDLTQLAKANLLILRKTRPYQFIAPSDLSERLSQAPYFRK